MMPCGADATIEGPVGLYVHVPFCASKCAYCDFASWAGKEELQGAWIGALEAEISYRRTELGDRPLDTIFVGGGTPTVLPTKILERLCRTLADLPRKKDAEWTVEANPGSLDITKLGLLRNHGVNRISIGVQSLSPVVLRRLGRTHTPAEARRACALLEKSGIRWNADLIFAVPGQRPADFLESLAELVGTGARHLSFYGLSIEPGTRFAREAQEGRLDEVDEEIYAQMYRDGAEFLESKGLARYEVSNFAAPGEECRHNQGYWRRDGAWLAVGNAAHGYRPGRRWSAPHSLQAWLAWADEGFPPEGCEEEALGSEERYTEAWLLGLRTRAGVDLLRLREEFGSRLDEARLRRWLDSGMLVRSNSTVRLQGEGWLLLDAIVADCSS